MENPLAGIYGSGCEDEHDDELEHSIVPVIREKPAVASVVSPSDHNASSDETNSFSDSGSEYEEDPMDPCQEHPKSFMQQVCTVVDEALEANDLSNVVDKILRLGDSYCVPSDIAENMFYQLAKSALEVHHESEDEFNNYIEKMIIEWKPLLKHFINSKFDEFGLISRLDWVCSDTVTPFSPFPKILRCLYENEIVCKHTILYWEHVLGWVKEPSVAFLNQSREFIEMLKQEPGNLDPTCLYDQHYINLDRLNM